MGWGGGGGVKREDGRGKMYKKYLRMKKEEDEEKCQRLRDKVEKNWRVEIVEELPELKVAAWHASALCRV